ncbi:glycosyltransferase family 4 protein [Empedobacter falsenii]|uniref:glycosyltransferase family 4 protein n=1 Tax=Empedobacter falsenii TaxID=343874 RepID=UPI001C562FF9|nr:glycosyltransferase family 4 protein [Empedobacter falsenii]MBW1619338.1 glycosyltransferase family 4 protein [Empedobacter falsenii]
MKIGFYSSSHLEDKKNWSGTMFKMYEQMISLDYEVERIPKLELSNQDKKKLDKIEKLYNQIFKRGYNRHLNIFSSKKIGKQIESYLKNKNFDVIFVPTYINDFAYVKTEIPIIYLNDANVGQLLNYYPAYSGFGVLSKLETKYIEKKFLKKSKVAIFPSEWASDFAVNQYNIEKNKVYTLKFGANIIVPNQLQKKEQNNKFTFLFLAVDWERKRGGLVYESLKILHEKGYPINMKIIGCVPSIDENWITIIPFLNKNSTEEFEQLQNHLFNSDFLFVPSKAECFGIVFCEAFGYGIPVISTNTGGIGTIVTDSYNGLLLAKNASAADYANAIEHLLNHPELISKMSNNARKKYEQELNWEKWGKDFERIIKKFITINE